MQALLGLTTANTEEIVVGGYYHENDGGGGTLIWKTGTATNDSGTIFGGSLLTGGLTGGYFQRLIPDGIINAKWFGLISNEVNATLTTPILLPHEFNTVQCQKLAQYINAQDGGEVFIPEGTYLVGKQELSGLPAAEGSWKGQNVFFISECESDVIFRGSNAVFRIPDSFRIGTFDPQTGLPSTTNSIHHKATVGYVFYFSENKKVIVEDITIDGNNKNLEVGGLYGDLGYQCEATGFYFFDNEEVIGNNLTSNYNGLDGFLVQNITVDNPYTTANESAIVKRVTLTNVKAIGNGRDGLSWNGGNHLCVINGKFNETGKTINASLTAGASGVPTALSSSPSSGLDIEPEYKTYYLLNTTTHTDVRLECRNGYFENCEFVNNAGWGMVASATALGNYSSDCHFQNCQFIAALGVCLTPSQPRFTFDNCKMVGTVDGVYGGYYNGIHTPGDAAKFTNCVLEISPESAYNYPNIVGSTLDNAIHAVFDKCDFRSYGETLLPVSNDTIYINCSFFQEQNVPNLNIPNTYYSNETQGRFYGETVFKTAGTLNTSGSRIFGRFTLNGTEVPVTYSYDGPLTRKSVRDGSSGGPVDVNVWHAFGPTYVGPASKGDTIFNTHYNIGSGKPAGWVCVASGNPGTWEPFGIIGMVQATASADSAGSPSATYDQTEVQAILTELRDLKTKLRTANVLLP
jgi:hypothetical protein